MSEIALNDYSRKGNNDLENSLVNGNMNQDVSYNSPRKDDGSDFDATALFERSLIDYPFEKFLNIAKKHSEGKIWVIGGFVYRNIIQELYGTPYEKRPIDIDFLVESHVRKAIRQRRWKHSVTDTGELCFTKGNRYKISINSFASFHSIASRPSHPDALSRPRHLDIEYFYKFNPLDIQAISYDCDERIVEGEKAFEAIQNKLIAVNNSVGAKWEADRISKKLGISVSVNDLVRWKVKELVGFKGDLESGLD